MKPFIKPKYNIGTTICGKVQTYSDKEKWEATKKFICMKVHEIELEKNEWRYFNENDESILEKDIECEMR